MWIATFSYLMVWWAHQVSERQALNPVSASPKDPFFLQGKFPRSVGDQVFVQSLHCYRQTLHLSECSAFQGWLFRLMFTL